MFLYDFATKTAQKPDTVATYIRRNEKIFKNHVERREKQLWLDEKAVKILLKKYPEVQRKKYPWWKNETEFVTHQNLHTGKTSNDFLDNQND